MSDIASSVSTPPAEADAEATLAQVLAELNQISARIRREQVEIDCLKAQSLVIAAHTDKALSVLQNQLDALAPTG